MIDLLLENGLVIAMDAGRRVLEATSVAIHGGRITEVGPAAELRARHRAARTIDCTRKAVLPGMVDLHGYLGGSLLKSVGLNLDGANRRKMLDSVIPHATDEEWWEADAQLSALERLKLGTTCMFSMMGGNGTRTDDVAFAHAAARQLERIGLRTRIGVGPARPPWPRAYSYWRDGVKTERLVGFDEVIANCDRLLSENRGKAGGIVDYTTALSRIGNRNEHDPVWDPEKERWIRRQAEAIRDLMRRHDVGFWTHMYGNAIEYAHDEKLELLGPRTILSHCTGISERAIGIMRETGAHAAHHPRAGRIYTYPGRCPVPELIEAGVTVALGADTPATHNCDIFLDMKAAIDQQRIHFKDPELIPPGKALEMATIDGCTALGLARELGSVEPGKQADLITVDFSQPHLAPLDMPVHRLVYHATGHDVRDVVVAGRLVMENRQILTVDEAEILERVERVYRRFMERAGLGSFARIPDRFWGISRS